MTRPLHCLIPTIGMVHEITWWRFPTNGAIGGDGGKTASSISKLIVESTTLLSFVSTVDLTLETLVLFDGMAKTETLCALFDKS